MFISDFLKKYSFSMGITQAVLYDMNLKYFFKLFYFLNSIIFYSLIIYLMQNQDDNIVGRTLFEMIEIFRTIELNEKESREIVVYTTSLYLADLK